LPGSLDRSQASKHNDAAARIKRISLYVANADRDINPLSRLAE
jgi:hypothetical protein